MSKPSAKYPIFGTARMAVFNCRRYGMDLGRKAVIEKYGEPAWKRVRARMKPGIMALFDRTLTPETRLYVETVAQHAEAWHAKRKPRPKKEGDWISIATTRPPVGEIVWLWDGNWMWVGSEESSDSYGVFFWCSTMGHHWWDKDHWDGDREVTEYTPTHWMRMPKPPASK